jgi:hypothetical protein
MSTRVINGEIVTFTQDDYDMLIEFCDWIRQFSEDLGTLEYDNNDEIVQRFLTDQP